MIKNLFFDLDDTILDFRTAERRAVARTLADIGVAATDEILNRYSEINLVQWKRLERGEITRKEVKEGRYRKLFEEFSICASPERTTAIYETHLSHGHIFMDGAEELLQNLYKNYNLYIVSNGTLSVQKGRIASADIAKFFKGIFISEELGADKPDKTFFDICFSKAVGLSKSETAIVGDSLTSDILGGKNAGVTTIWYNPRGEMKKEILPDYEIKNLFDLPPLLEKINIK